MARIDDGFPTTIAFSEAPEVKFYEKEVTPPGMEGGGANDISTMQNTVWRTRAPKGLKTLSEATLVAAYDPEVYNDVVAMMNVNQEITITFPDDSILVFWGWLDVFKPNRTVEGEQPTAEITIIPSNIDAAGDEVAPVYETGASS